MLSRCIFCHADLPPNETLEHFAVGKRIAFDPGRGRLWCVCGLCHRWNLAPFEERWEALEELEKLAHDQGRLLAQSDNVALLRVLDLDVIRVGRAQLVEEAWWRYGKELQRRHSRNQVLQVVQVGTWIAGLALLNGFWMLGGGNAVRDVVRWRKFGSTLWRGERRCAQCGRQLRELKFDKAKHLYLSTDLTGAPALQLDCKRCGYAVDQRGFTFTGIEAERMLRRDLAYANFAGTNEKGVKQAIGAIDELGSPHSFIQHVAKQKIKLSKLGQRIALEIAVNDQAERELLELELAELEARWREEEELAAIVDGELTELPFLERLRTRLPG